MVITPGSLKKHKQTIFNILFQVLIEMIGENMLQIENIGV